MKDSGSVPERGNEGIFFFVITSRPPLVPTQHPIQWIPRNISKGVKWPGRDVNHSTRNSAEFKNASSYTSTPPYGFVVWCLIMKEIHLQGVQLS
jgi:hypothetical protein